jgi:hypothetical protein
MTADTAHRCPATMTLQGLGTLTIFGPGGRASRKILAVCYEGKKRRDGVFGETVTKVLPAGRLLPTRKFMAP